MFLNGDGVDQLSYMHSGKFYIGWITYQHGFIDALNLTIHPCVLFNPSSSPKLSPLAGSRLVFIYAVEGFTGQSALEIIAVLIRTFCHVVSYCNGLSKWYQTTAFFDKLITVVGRSMGSDKVVVAGDFDAQPRSLVHQKLVFIVVAPACLAQRKRRQAFPISCSQSFILV